MSESEEERTERLRGKGWIGVDLDGTLAYYDKWVAIDVIGPPIPAMVNRVKKWLAEGHEVKIVTARWTGRNQECLITGKLWTPSDLSSVFDAWCIEHIGQALDVTATKDFKMIELWDDRAIQVIANTGRTLAEEHASELAALRGAP